MTPRPPIGNAVGNGRRRALDRRIGFLSEDRLDVGGIAVNIRQHDDHIPGLDRGSRIPPVIKDPKQLVMQDFDFALWAVGHMEGDGVIVPSDGGGLFVIRGQRP